MYGDECVAEIIIAGKKLKRLYLAEFFSVGLDLPADILHHLSVAFLHGHLEELGVFLHLAHEMFKGIDSPPEAADLPVGFGKQLLIMPEFLIESLLMQARGLFLKRINIHGTIKFRQHGHYVLKLPLAFTKIPLIHGAVSPEYQ